MKNSIPFPRAKDRAVFNPLGRRCGARWNLIISKTLGHDLRGNRKEEEKIFRTEEASFEKVGLVVISVSVHDSIRVPVCLFRAFEENIGSSLAVDSNISSRR